MSSTAAALTPEQKAGQLVMVALQAGQSADSLRTLIEGSHIGNVVYLGGWSTGHADITATSALLQRQATAQGTGGVGLLIAADQEGGVVQQLKGAGFTSLPSALTQSSGGPAQITRQAASIGAELKSAGVNYDLAPVADTVPAELGKGNGPIGQHDRQYGSDPATVSTGSTAFVRGLQQAGVASSLKHFPGIGRLQGNTDYTAEGLDDPVMTGEDSYLQPFAAGIKAGASSVMISSATYPKIDGANPAMFSSAIIDGLLRTRLGFAGVAITDDINAVSVRGIPATERATRFIAAGGDIVLTGDTASGPSLVEAIVAKAASDRAFAAKVDASVARVLTLKQKQGLMRCS